MSAGRPLGICVVTPTFLPAVGGAEIAIDRLVRAWRAAGHRAVVLAPRPRTPAADAEHGYPVRRHRRQRSTRGAFRGVRRALRRWHDEASFDVVNAHMAYPAGWVACRFSEESGVPAVVTCQGGDVSRTSRFRGRVPVEQRLAWALRTAAAVTTVSEELADAVGELSGGRRPVVVPNGVEPDVAVPAEPPAGEPWFGRLQQHPFFLDLKRLHPAKGHDLLLEAYAAALARAPDLPLLVIAGDGPQRRELEALRERLGLERHVVMAGHVEGDAKRWLLQGCAALVHPSRREGMPLVVLEAMACGRAVLAVRSEGVSAQVEHGVSGLLVEPDDREGLTGGLLALRDAGVAAAFGTAGRERAAPFAWPDVARRYVAVFRDVLASSRAGGS